MSKTIAGRGPERGPELLKGGRVVYNPFAHTAHVSEHYDRQYEISNLPAPQQTAWYDTLMGKIGQLKARNPTPAQSMGWFKALYDGMVSGKA